MEMCPISPPDLNTLVHFGQRAYLKASPRRRLTLAGGAPGGCSTIGRASDRGSKLPICSARLVQRSTDTYGQCTIPLSVEWLRMSCHGGKAWARKLSTDRLREIVRNVVEARWARHKAKKL